MIALSWYISCVDEVVGTFLFAEGVEQRTDAFPRLLDGPGVGLTQQRFEFCEHLLDGVQIGAVRRQEDPSRTSGSDGVSNGLAFVAAEVVQHHDIARLEGGDEALFDPGQEGGPIDRPIKDKRRTEPVTAQTGDECQRLPVPMRNLCHQALSRSRPATQTGHVGLCPGLIDKDQAPWVDLMLMFLPERALACHVGSILLGCVQAFF